MSPCPLLRRVLHLALAASAVCPVALTAQARLPRTLIVGAGRFDERVTLSEGGVPREPRGTGWQWNAEWSARSNQSLRYERASLPVRSASGSETWATQTVWWRLYDGKSLSGLRLYGETGWAWRRLGGDETQRRGDGWAWGAGATYVVGSRVALDAGYQALRVGSLRRGDGTGAYMRSASERWFAGARVRVWPLR